MRSILLNIWANWLKFILRDREIHDSADLNIHRTVAEDRGLTRENEDWGRGRYVWYSNGRTIRENMQPSQQRLRLAAAFSGSHVKYF